MKKTTLCLTMLLILAGGLGNVWAAGKEKITEKLKIVIPKVRFENRDLDFAADFLKRISRDLDADGVGINIIILVKKKKGEKEKLINLDADNITVAEFIKYVCDQLDLEYVVEKNAVLIGNDARLSKLETKFYILPSSMVGIVAGNGKADFTDFFKKLGIKFPPGAKMVHVKKVSRLVVTNTAEEHKKIRKIFSQIGAPQR
jgi:hypothetical protein